MIELKKAKEFFPGRAIEYQDTVFETGKAYLLTGCSGAGKTTLFNLISGLLLPSEGEVLLDGVSLSSLSAAERQRLRSRRIGYVFQDFRLLEGMSAEDNIRLLEISGVTTKDLAKTAERLGIEQLLKRRVGTLSGGEKQRVAIARAVVKRPDIILADEPAGNLDARNREAIIPLLFECAKGRTLIVASHDLSFESRFDGVYRLEEGGAV